MDNICNIYIYISLSVYIIDNYIHCCRIRSYIYISMVYCDVMTGCETGLPLGPPAVCEWSQGGQGLWIEKPFIHGPVVQEEPGNGAWRWVNFWLTIWLLNIWKFHYKWRFKAGKIIRFYGPFSIAMLNNQRVLFWKIDVMFFLEIYIAKSSQIDIVSSNLRGSFANPWWCSLNANLK